MNTSQWFSALWEQFCLLPWQARAALALALVLLLVGAVVVSLGAGRVVGWAGERRVVPRVVRAVLRRREWRVRVARRGPQRLVDRQARALLAALDGDEREEADR